MKKMRLYRWMSWVLAFGALMTWIIPAENAMAETEWDEVVVESAPVILTPGDAYEEPEVSGEETEDVFATEHTQAEQILEDNLISTGITLNGEQRLYDFFGKFNEEEQEEISSWIIDREEEGGISIRVFVAGMAVEDEKYFLEECADALCDNGYAKEDLAIMLLNLDEDNRGVCIQGYGICETKLNDDRIEYILDDIIAWFLEDDYVYGVKLFAEEAAYYVTAEEEKESVGSVGIVIPVDRSPQVPYYKDNSFKGKLNRMPWPFLVIAPMAVAGLGIFLMIQSNGSKKTTNNKTYMENETSGLTAQRDDYIRTSISRTYSPRSSGTSGGSRSGGRSSGGGGRSGGGRSHSGGSRRF